MGYECKRKSTGNKTQEETTKIHFPLINYTVKQSRRDGTERARLRQGH